MSLEVTPITAALPVHSDNERLSSAFEAALAPSAWRAYGSAWNAWRRWAADHNLDETPATPRHRGAASRAPGQFGQPVKASPDKQTHRCHARARYPVARRRFVRAS